MKIIRNSLTCLKLLASLAFLIVTTGTASANDYIQEIFNCNVDADEASLVNPKKILLPLRLQMQVRVISVAGKKKVQYNS